MDITKMEYFAAHAPKDVPGWFEPTMAEYPQRGKDEYIESYRDRESKWHSQREIQKTIQWPWYWAEQVLKNHPK